MKVSVNDRVSVRLTKEGEKICRQHRKQRGIRLYSPERDRHGQSEFQLWDLMNIFGQKIGICKPTPFMDSAIEFLAR